MDGLLEPKDIVFTKDADGEILSGGFSVNSIFFKLGMSPLQTLMTKGGKKNINRNEDEVEEDDEDEVAVSKLMYDDGFAVPIGLLCERALDEEDYDDDDFDFDDDFDYEEEDDINVLSDDLYAKLLGIQTETNAKIKKKKMTRKRLSGPPITSASSDLERKHKKTRKHKVKEVKEEKKK
jgi:hypothetical protein